MSQFTRFEKYFVEGRQNHICVQLIPRRIMTSSGGHKTEEDPVFALIFLLSLELGEQNEEHVWSAMQ